MLLRFQRGRGINKIVYSQDPLGVRFSSQNVPISSFFRQNSQLLGYSKFSFCSKNNPPVPKINKCYYETLDVDKEANSVEIKDAYHEIAKKFHPDRNPEALEYFTHVTKAYETLYDDHKRAIYDEDSLTDAEFFTIKIGPIKLNLLIIFPLTFIIFLAYFGNKLLNKKKGPCPIDHDHQQMFKRK
ncbi:unnamed protein product [Moneuplotes crassus]|uniref:J domain-containing protein n=1 Tax=Euplotes crassus TaxID=5936 RepID=A0AAD1XY75_EUPCR|nr:unnamed protein product [Moneuplotes crassus]